MLITIFTFNNFILIISIRNENDDHNLSIISTIGLGIYSGLVGVQGSRKYTGCIQIHIRRNECGRPRFALIAWYLKWPETAASVTRCHSNDSLIRYALHRESERDAALLTANGRRATAKGTLTLYNVEA